MDYNLTTFKEPRGVMRIFHLIFSICAFATICGYSGYVIIKCKNIIYNFDFFYPFDLNLKEPVGNCTATLVENYSSDPKFFVATGVLSMLYTIFIIIVYLKYDDLYKSNTHLPLADFVITVIFGVLWISSSAAWANSLAGIKYGVNHITIENCDYCTKSSTSFSSLDISVILGFLNFFLWAADLWFLYKETIWFQGNQQQQQATSGV